MLPILYASYPHLSSDLILDFDLGLDAPGRDLTLPISLSGNFWDAIIGLKGNIKLSDRWFIPYYLDIGAGDSDLTWQATAGISFHAGQKIDLALVYSHLDWNLDASSVYDLSFSGPQLGVVLRF